MKKLSHTRSFQSISGKLFKMIFALYIIITLIISIFNTTIEYFRTKEQMINELNKIPKTFGFGLSQALWSYDYVTLNEILIGMLEKEIVNGLEATDEYNKPIITLGSFEEKNNTIMSFFNKINKKSFDLVYPYEKERIYVGKIHVHYTSKSIFSEIIYTLFYISLNSILFICLLYFFLRVIIKKLLGTPLLLLTEKVKQISLINSNIDLLNNIIKSNNELKILETSFNIMINRNSQQYIDLQNSEEKYKRIINNLTNSFLYRYDTEGIFTYVSPSMTNILGYETVNFLKHYTTYLTNNPINKKVTKHTILSIKGIQQPPYELEIYHKNGSRHFLEIAEVPIKNSEGITIAVEGIAHDITKRKIAENKLISINTELDIRVKNRTNELEEKNKELLELNRKLEVVNKAKRIFLANMSHEIRTPLNTIIGFSELSLKHVTLDEELKENLMIINQSGDNLLRIINDILTISKIESGYVNYSAESFDLFKLIYDIEDMFKLKIAEKELKLKIAINEDVPQFIIIDQSKLRQILVNLLNNALKFTQKGNIYIRVSSRENQKNKCILNFEIEDTGAGINSSDVKNIFKAFERSVESEKVYNGAGLGLAICKKFIDLMNGDIYVKSTEGKGTIFIINIPVDLGEKIIIESESKKGEVLKVKSDFEQTKILIVDDVDNNRLVLDILLKSAGFKTETAENGIQAIEKTMSWEPDLILMDIRMPELDGIETTKRIKKIRKIKNENHLPIIAVTASAFDEDIEYIMNAGFSDCLKKPLQDGEIFEKIKEHLKIEYDYKIEELDNKEDNEIIFPPDNICDEIIKSVDLGEITLIYEILIEVNKTKKYKPFIDKINKYLDNFDFDRIIELLNDKK